MTGDEFLEGVKQVVAEVFNKSMELQMYGAVLVDGEVGLVLFPDDVPSDVVFPVGTQILRKVVAN